MSSIKKLKRKKAKEKLKAFKSNQIKNKIKYAPIIQRKRELELLGLHVLYYVSMPDKVKENRIVENFNDLGILIYEKNFNKRLKQC